MINESTSPRPRGRPRAFDRDQALAQARETFWRLGYEGASIADLTAAMGITPQSLYAAFTSKADLYREALAQYRGTAGAFIARALAEEPTAAAAFDRLLREAAHEYARPDQPTGCMLSTAIITCAAENRIVADHVADLRREVLEAFRARIERGLREGDVPAGTEADSTARFVQAVVQGISIQAGDGADEDSLAALARIARAELTRRLSG